MKSIALLAPVRARTSGTAVRTALVAFWTAVAGALWAASPYETLPSPREVLAALGELWAHEGMGPELVQTLALIGEATVLTAALSLALAYASVLPAFRPLALGLTKLRFLSLTGLVVPLTLVTGGGGALKLALLTFGMSAFYLTAMARIVAEIPEEELDHMRVLGASDARIVWEVVVRGTLDRALDALRQNVAMGWSMITMVEGISRADGGIGALLLNQHKHFRLAHVYAVLLVVLGVGLVIDALMVELTLLVCPHTRTESTEDTEGKGESS
jgi:NitT/TauT family transport system permease protein